MVYNTGLFISPSGTSELSCITTKTDTAERNISIGAESLQAFCLRGSVAYLQVSPLGGSHDENMAWIGNTEAFCVLEYTKIAKFGNYRVTKGGHIEHL
jgi:hypothetical protein